jgi:hypothetical protein
MDIQARITKRRWLQLGLVLAAAAGGYAAAMLVLAAPSAPTDAGRMAACIRELAKYENSLTYEQRQQRERLSTSTTTSTTCVFTEPTM